MKKLTVIALLALAAGSAAAQAGQSAPAPKPAAPAKPVAPADVNKTLYDLGLAIAGNLAPFSLTAPEMEQVVKGLRDGVTGKATLDPKAQEAIQQLAQARMNVKGEREKTRGPAHAEKMAKEKGAQKTASGLVYIPVQEGKGASPAAADQVKVNYTGRFVDGTVFDASAKHGGPATFPLNRVIPCWTEAVQKMKVGGKAKIVCPPSIAYGADGSPPTIPGNATLEFEIELLDVVKGQAGGMQMPPGHPQTGGGAQGKPGSAPPKPGGK